MAFVHGRNSVVLVNKFDLSQYFNEASISNSVETAETTAFGNSAKTYISGLKDGTISLSGMFEAGNGASSIDKVISDALQVDDAVFTFAPERKNGGAAFSCIADPTSYEVSSSVSDLVSASAELQSDKGIDRCFILSGAASSHSTTHTTAQSNQPVGNAADFGGVATVTSGVVMVAYLHVTANTWSGTADFKIQVSADNSSFADYTGGSFTQVAASTTTQQRLEINYNAAVLRYVRAVCTTGAGSGSITYTITLARR